MLGLEPGTIELGGDLVVSAELVADADIAARRSHSLEQQAIAHARDAQDEAGWAWVPDLSVTGGLRLGIADDTRYGYVAGLALSIPLFSRSQDLRARARASRNMAQARLAAIVDSSEDAIIGMSLDAVIQTWNRGAERLYGYTAAEAVGRHISFMIPPERAGDLAAVQAFLLQAHPHQVAGEGLEQEGEHGAEEHHEGDGQPPQVLVDEAPDDEQAHPALGQLAAVRAAR